MLNSADYYRFSDLYSVCLKTIDHLSFKSWIFSGHTASFKIRVLKVQDFANFFYRERSGSVVECLTQDRRAAGSSLTGVTVLCPWARHINPSLVLVQPRKTRPFITERLLMGRKESYQTNKQTTFLRKKSHWLVQEHA